MERKPRVILFEDNESILQLLEQLLRERGCEVFSYEDPSLCRLQRSHDCQCSENERCADIIITDIDMPTVSGIDFIEDQKRKGCNIKNIAIMSGAMSPTDRKRAEDIGCKIFDKPFSFPSLLKWFDKSLAEASSSRTLSNWFLEDSKQ